jgi:hypothetical protein
MRLFMVTDNDRWGWSRNLVRAESPEQAKQLVCPKSRDDMVEIEEIPSGDEARILWCHDESPDTGPEPYDD